MLKINLKLGDHFYIGSAKVWINRDTENRVSVAIEAPRDIRVLRSKFVDDQGKEIKLPSKKQGA